MKILKYFGVFVLFAVCTSSCNDDKFLEEEPITFYTVDNYFTNAGQVDQVLITIYSQLRDLWVNPTEAAWIFNLKGKGTDMYDVPNIRLGNTFSDYSVINPGHATFYEVYSVWYTIIGWANLAIYAADLPQVTWTNETEKGYALAQAKFFRAFAYKNLGELFGGVPIVTEISNAPRFDFERSTRVDTYKFAISEIESVLGDLPQTTSSGGRLVRGAAQHNLSELYLALGTQLESEGELGEAQAAYESSIMYANSVIDGGGYSLITKRFGQRKDEKTFSIDIHRNGLLANEIVDTIQFEANHYWDLFQEGNINYQEGNTECIWALQIDYGAYRSGDTKSKLPYSRSFGPVFRNVGNWVGGTLQDVGGRGISQVNITMYARDEIYSGVFADDLRNSEAVFRRRFKGNISTSEYYLRDLPWDLIYNGSADEIVNQNTRSLVYPVSCKIATDRYTGLTEGEDMSNLFRDEYVIRLAETILLRAEAKQRNGDKAGAAADINLLRQRSACSYLVTAADMDDDFNMILDERARELVYEERRWNTLLRMGGNIAVNRIREHAYWPITRSTLNFDYNLWPIPQSVIDSNKDVELAQNPGWTNR